MAMLRRHCDLLDERAELADVELAIDPFHFSLAVDCLATLPPDYLTKRVAKLKGHLGIEDKRPQVRALEKEVLRRRRQALSQRPNGRFERDRRYNTLGIIAGFSVLTDQTPTSGYVELVITSRVNPRHPRWMAGPSGEGCIRGEVL